MEAIEHIDKFICPNLCPQLCCLRIPYCTQKLVDWIFSGAFPQLKICHFYNSRYEKTVRLPTMTSTIPTLHQLTIHEVTDEFEKIFLLCPNLVYFDFDRTSVFPSFIHLNSSYSSLKCLKIQRLNNFLFHNGQFDSLLACFSNLRLLHLTVYQCDLHDETLDFHKVAYYFRHRLPCLTVLDLCIYLTRRNADTYSVCELTEIAQMHPLFKCFGRSYRCLRVASFDFTAMCMYDHPVFQSFSEVFFCDTSTVKSD
jgi:hypothetical protein